MSNFVSIKYFTDEYRTKHGVLHSTASLHKTKYGHLPHWYKKTGKADIWIDEEHFLHLQKMSTEAWHWLTSPEYGFYWHLMQYINLSELSRKLAARSYIFKSATSWRTYLQYQLFSLSQMKFKIKTTRKVNMLEEFLLLAPEILLFLVGKMGIREYE